TWGTDIAQRRSGAQFTKGGAADETAPERHPRGLHGRVACAARPLRAGAAGRGDGRRHRVMPSSLAGIGVQKGRAMHRLCVLTVLVAALPLSASAESYRHGRIRHVEEGVSIQRGTETGSEEAVANLPFLPGDRVWTDAG